MSQIIILPALPEVQELPIVPEVSVEKVAPVTEKKATIATKPLENITNV